MNDHVALFDMDGTLFDYDGQIRRDLERIKSPGEAIPDDMWDESQPWLKARIDLIKSQPGWWRKLPKFQLGWDLLAETEFVGFEVEILSKAPRSNHRARAEKCECIEAHLGLDYTVNLVGKDKSRYYGRVLCDDYPDYVTGWLQHRPRGLVIMPAHRYNAGFTHRNVIRYDGSNMAEVSAALKAAFARTSGEHWLDRLK
jgi:hypothetical protein